MSRSSRRVHVATDTHQTTLVAETPLLAEEYLLGGMEKEEQDEWPELRHSSFPLCAARGKFLKAVQRRQASHLLSSNLVCFPTRVVREKIVRECPSNRPGRHYKTELHAPIPVFPFHISLKAPVVKGFQVKGSGALSVNRVDCSRTVKLH